MLEVEQSCRGQTKLMKSHLAGLECRMTHLGMPPKSTNTFLFQVVKNDMLSVGMFLFVLFLPKVMHAY